MSNGKCLQLVDVNPPCDERRMSIIAPPGGNVITNVHTLLPTGRARGPIIVNTPVSFMS